MLKKSLLGIALWIPALIMIVLLVSTAILLPRPPDDSLYAVWILLTIGAGICLVLFLSIWGFKKLYQWKKSYFYLALGSLIIIPRIIWIIWIPTHAVSDFYYYQVIASYIADNNNWTTLYNQGILFYAPYFTHILNFSNILSIVYNIFGNNYLVGQLFNSVLTLAGTFLLFKVVKNWFPLGVAVGSSLIFALWPAYFMYSTLLATEPLFIFLFVLALFFYQQVEQRAPSFIWSLLLVLTLIGLNMIRPLAVVILIAFVITSFLLRPNRKETLKRYAIVVALFLIFLAGQSTINKLVYHIPTANSTVGYNVFVGANEKTGGQWNEADTKTFWKLYNDNKTNTAKVDSTLMQKGLDRYKTMAEDGKLTDHVIAKMKNYSNEGYGYDWNIYSDAPYIWYHSAIILTICNVFMYIMLGLNFLAVVLALYLRRIADIYLFVLLQIGFTVATLLVEVQGRYHVPLLIGYVVIAAWGCWQVYRLVLGKTKKKPKKETPMSGEDMGLELWNETKEPSQ
ncbi:ArnT family glycosyltransferase [Listeria booriae]|uniref:ArnT family glycosyltransferase n=1 Tax=Listeria booriae TaxID=1552123 RepID=UPI001626C52F|nr:glycosyltransferase family 39 protein [Listeria booriae]MBC2206130.1 hypothetical protein [Listeria booriae]